MSNSTSSGASVSTSVIVTTETSTVDPTSVSVVTETSTVTSASTTPSTTESTTSSVPSTTSSRVESSTTSSIESTTSSRPATTASSSIPVVTSVITETPTSQKTPQSPTVVTITSTAPTPTHTEPTSATSHTTSTKASTTPSTLGAAGEQGGSSGKLSSGGTIAIAVVIPIVAIALIIAFLIFFFKRRNRRDQEKKDIQKQMAEYGYNPNNDATLIPAAAAYTDNASETAEENNGYRGWGNTSSTQRKPSTTMGSGNKRVANGNAMSDDSQYGYANGAHNAYSPEPLSGDTLNGPGELAATGVGAGVAGAALARHTSNSDVHRGPSNASSAYSSGQGQRSELSADEAPGMPGPYYHEEVPHNIYNEASHRQGPYGDGTYGGPPNGGGQPMVQNVGARQNPRIERTPNFGQQGGGPSIAQNF